VCGTGATYIFASNEPVGDFPTSATALLNRSDEPDPVWFLNRRELIGLFVSHGYGLACQGLHDRVYDLSNPAPDRRWRQASHLLFTKGAGPG
jgi:hypothetical protein